MGSDMKTELVLLSYLQYGNYDDREFTNELSALNSQIKTECPSMTMFRSMIDGDLQSDGNNFSRPGGDPTNLQIEESEADICLRIGRCLAEIGDGLVNQVQQEVIDQLVQNLLDDRLSTEEKSMRLSSVIDSLMVIIPSGLEHETAKLLLAMLLAKKVGSSLPGLLPRVFWTTIGYINQHLPASIDSFIRLGRV